MLMISIFEGFNQRSLVPEGTLIGLWATELLPAVGRERTFGDRELDLDMKNVTTISQERDNVLLELMNEGHKFRGSGVFAEYLLRQIAGKLRRKVWYPICVNHKREGHHE
ncbi:MAG TPA: hypothetical protein VFS12_15255 [Terriglobia bacterium]|nr:hypothetical protein [Terriglobia bacterium]